MNCTRCRNILCWCVLAATAASGAERWRFIVTCDSRQAGTGVNEPVLAELASEVVRHRADFLLYPGDLVHGVRATPNQFEQQLWNWVQVMRPIYEAGIGVYVCRGNHEAMDVAGAEPGTEPDPIDNHALRWLRVFGNAAHPDLMLPDNGPAGEEHMTYAVVHKNAMIVSLDQYAGIRHQIAHRVNQDWLDERLERNAQPHVFVFGHEPAFRTYHSDCLDAFPSRRDALWESIKRAGGRTYFCGHDHYYDHAVVDDGDGMPENDIHQLIVATAGAPFYTWAPPYLGDNSYFLPEQLCHAPRYGYVLVEVDDLEVTLTWMERRSNDLSLPPLYGPAETWGYRVEPGPVVLWPNGNERLAASQAHTVRWKTTGGADIRQVVIEYSADEGANWTPVDRVTNSGCYEWRAPAVDSDACLLRIRDADRLHAYDVSDRPFSLFHCPLQLRADLNGDCRVDFDDLAILLGEWLMCGNPDDPACDPLP